MPGADLFATTIMTYSPFLYIVIAMIPRILMGWLAGLLAVGLKKCRLTKAVWSATLLRAL